MDATAEAARACCAWAASQGALVHAALSLTDCGRMGLGWVAARPLAAGEALIAVSSRRRRAAQ